MKRKLSLEELIEILVNEKNHNPHDSSFTIIIDKYPKEAHDTYNFPGKYVKSLNKKVYTSDGRKLEMDYAALIMPDGVITQKSTVNVEHQSTRLNQDKIKTIYDYKIGLIHDTNLPSISFVITKIKNENDDEYYYAYNNLFNIIVYVVKRDEIYERLNILRNKISNNEKLTIREALNFSFIANFVDDDIGKEVIGELCELFTRTELNIQLKLRLHFVLKKMIKYHFKNDVNKIRELLTMITKTIPEEKYEELSLNESLILKIQDKDNTINSMNETFKLEIQDRDNKINTLHINLEKKDNVITKQQSEITQQKDEIKRLKKTIRITVDFVDDDIGK